MMFTMGYESAYNSPCHGIHAASSASDCKAFSTTVLCAYAFFDKGLVIDHISYVANDRPKTIASRLVQLCDEFDREFFEVEGFQQLFEDLEVLALDLLDWHHYEAFLLNLSHPYY